MILFNVMITRLELFEVNLSFYLKKPEQHYTEVDFSLTDLERSQ